MRRIKNEKQGFALVEGLLIILIIVIIGAVGWYVRHAKTSTSSTYNTASKTAASNPKQTSQKPKPVYQKDGLTLYDVADLATTADQKSLALAAQAQCASKLNNTTAQAVFGDTSVFASSNTYAQSGNFARLDVNCFVPPTPSFDAIENGYIYEKIAGKWTIITSDMNGIPCSDVDGKNVPRTVVATCIDSSTERAPQ